MSFKLPIGQRILIEGTFRVMRITLSKNLRSLCTIDMAVAQTSIKMIKHDFLKFWQKLQIWERIKMKIIKAIFLKKGNTFLTPVNGAENRFSIPCLVCTTELTQ